MPFFGVVVDIIVTHLQECLFVIHALVADYFHIHFHAYRAVITQLFIVILSCMITRYFLPTKFIPHLITAYMYLKKQIADNL